MIRASLIVVLCVLGVGAIAASVLWVRARQHPEQAHPNAWVEGYSAEYRLINLKNPGKSSHGRMFTNVLSEPRGLRYERILADNVRVMVWKQQEGSHWMLDPAARTYWRAKAEVRSRLVAGSELDGYPGEPLGTQRERVGVEKVNGREAEHVRVTEPRDGEKYTWDFWYDPRLHSMIKVVKPGESEYELTGIREGTQAAELFEVPPEFTRIEAPER